MPLHVIECAGAAHSHTNGWVVGLDAVWSGAMTHVLKAVLRRQEPLAPNPGIPEKPPGLPRASALLAARNACSSTRNVPYAAAMRALRRLRRSGGRGMPMAVRTMRLRCVLLQDRGGAWHALLRSQSAHRNEAEQQAGCCQQGPMLPHARIVQRGPAHTGFTPSPSHV